MSCISREAVPIQEAKHSNLDQRLKKEHCCFHLNYFVVSAHLTEALLVKLLLFTTTLLGHLQPIMKSDRRLSHTMTKETSKFDTMRPGPGFVSALDPRSTAK